MQTITTYYHQADRIQIPDQDRHHLSQTDQTDRMNRMDRMDRHLIRNCHTYHNHRNPTIHCLP